MQTQQEIYEALQEAYDAYEALTEEEQALLSGADCFEALFGWFNAQVSTQEAGKTGSGIYCTATGWLDMYGGSYTVTAGFTMADGYAQLPDATAKLTIARRDIAAADIVTGAALTANGETQAQTLASVKLGELTLTAAQEAARRQPPSPTAGRTWTHC